MQNTITGYEYILTEGRWVFEGQCTCGGTLTYKYRHLQHTGVKLKIKPVKKKFDLYAMSRFSHKKVEEYNRPLEELKEFLNKYEL